MKKQLLKIAGTSVFTFLASAPMALAQTAKSATWFPTISGFGDQDLVVILNNVITWVLYATGAAAVTMLIIGGFQYAISRGDEKAVGKAKNTITYAIIGVVIVIIAQAIVFFVANQLLKGTSSSTL